MHQTSSALSNHQDKHADKVMQSSWLMGWDVGGAHVKAALLNDQGLAVKVVQLACPLWRGVDELVQAVQNILAQMPVYVTQHALTMTGELADIFPNRHTGVVQIAACVATCLENHLSEKKISENHLSEKHPTLDLRIFAGMHGFVSLPQVHQHTAHIASANWVASARYVAQQVSQGLLIDYGSTTTDFVIVAEGQPQLVGLTDAARLQSDELVYTGMLRTPLMAVASRVAFLGQNYHVAAEHFATMADVYRILGETLGTDAVQHDMAETADGADKSVLSSARRLARMIGHDVEDADLKAWQQLAWAFYTQQMQTLQTAALRHLSRGLVNADAPLILAGVGHQALVPLAQRLNRPILEINTLIFAENKEAQYWARVCFPAYAVAQLARDTYA